MRPRPKWRIFAIAAVALLALSACGGDDTTASGGSSGDTTDGGGGAAASGECGGSGGTALSLTAENTAFSPTELKAPAGEQVTVSFENKDSFPHTFTISDMSCDTGSVDGGSSADLSFTMPDSPTDFVCTIHSNMKGTLTPE